MGSNRPPIDKVIAALIALVAAATAGAVVVSIVDEDENGRPDRVTITLGGHDDVPAGLPAGPETLELAPQAVADLEDVKDNQADDHAGLDDERPATLPAGAAEALPDYLELNAERNDLPDLSPLAAPEQAGCVTRLVANFSSRYGVRPRQIWAHYTVSRNRNGWDDVNAIVGYFNNRASSASSNYVIDAEGNCAYIVRETDKAWTQAAANPYAVSIEHIAYGDEAHLYGPGGRAKTGKVYDAIARRWDIPLTRGGVNTATCVPTAAGIVQHADGGGCAGGHHDVNPFPIGDVIDAARDARRLRHRRARHRQGHAAYRRAGCRRGVHNLKLRPRELGREECRDRIRRLRRQDRGIAKTRRALRAV